MLDDLGAKTDSWLANLGADLKTMGLMLADWETGLWLAGPSLASWETGCVLAGPMVPDWEAGQSWQNVSRQAYPVGFKFIHNVASHICNFWHILKLRSPEEPVCHGQNCP